MPAHAFGVDDALNDFSLQEFVSAESGGIKLYWVAGLIVYSKYPAIPATSDLRLLFP